MPQDAVLVAGNRALFANLIYFNMFGAISENRGHLVSSMQSMQALHEFISPF